MQSNERIVRYTASEIQEMRRNGESLIDFARLETMTEEALEASIDHEEVGEIHWSSGRVGIPRTPRQITLLLDGDVIDWFAGQGAGYENRMNAVLAAYIDAQGRRAGPVSEIGVTEAERERVGSATERD